METSKKSFSLTPGKVTEEAMLKICQIILQARVQFINEQPEINKYFNLEMSEFASLRNLMTKHIAVSLYTVFQFDILLNREDDKPILLERWILHYEQLAPIFNSNTVDPASLYRRMIILCRSLYCQVRQLPAFGLFRSLSARSSSMSQFGIYFSYSAVSPGSEAYSNTPLSSGTQVWDTSPASFVFSPISSGSGKLHVSVTYRRNCDFEIEKPISILMNNAIISDYVQEEPHSYSSARNSVDITIPTRFHSNSVSNEISKSAATSISKSTISVPVGLPMKGRVTGFTPTQNSALNNAMPEWDESEVTRNSSTSVLNSMEIKKAPIASPVKSNSGLSSSLRDRSVSLPTYTTDISSPFVGGNPPIIKAARPSASPLQSPFISPHSSPPVDNMLQIPNILSSVRLPTTATPSAPFVSSLSSNNSFSNNSPTLPQLSVHRGSNSPFISPGAPPSIHVTPFSLTSRKPTDIHEGEFSNHASSNPLTIPLSNRASINQQHLPSSANSLDRTGRFSVTNPLQNFTPPSLAKQTSISGMQQRRPSSPSITAGTHSTKSNPLNLTPTSKPISQGPIPAFMSLPSRSSSPLTDPSPPFTSNPYVAQDIQPFKLDAETHQEQLPRPVSLNKGFSPNVVVNGFSLTPFVQTTSQSKVAAFYHPEETSDLDSEAEISKLVSMCSEVPNLQFCSIGKNQSRKEFQQFVMGEIEKIINVSGGSKLFTPN